MIPCNDIKRSFNIYQEEFEEKVIQVLRSGWYILGKEDEKFEQQFARINGAKYCISVDNATNAIFLGLKALGIKDGDEVIVQANTYIATVLGITRNGATPIFVEPNEYYNMNSDIEKYFTKNTKAVLVTHLFGQATNMKRIIELCDKNGIYLLEDCSQAHFAEYNKKKVGTIGKLGFFSFYPTKNIGAFGDAGAIITNDKNLDERLRQIRNYGSVSRYNFVHDGINARMDEIQAGILQVRLNHWQEITNEKIKIANKYLKGINNKLIIKPGVDENCTSVWHLFVIQVKERDKFRNYLKENGISSDIHYPEPPYLSKCYSYLGYNKGDFPITEYYSEHMVDLPIFNGMTDEEIDYIIEVINKYE